MSIKLMSQAWDTNAKGNELIVLLSLADFANDEGYCFPSWSILMEKCKISKDTLARVLNKLENDGYIIRESRKRTNGSDASNGYIVLQNIDAKSENRTTKVRKSDTMQSTKIGHHAKSDFSDTYMNHQVIKKRVSKDTPKKDLVNSNKSEFTPPKREEILNYVTEHKLCVDIEKFIKYYTASNWRDNKGKQVKNWKLKLITWDTSKGNKQQAQQDLSTIPLDQIKDLDERMAEAERRRQANIDKWEKENGIF